VVDRGHTRRGKLESTVRVRDREWVRSEFRLKFLGSFADNILEVTNVSIAEGHEIQDVKRND
jgi:hypothetical protein